MRSTLSIACLALCLPLLAQGSLGDVIQLKTGRLEGEILEKSNGQLRIRTTTGIVTTIDEADILSIEQRDTPHQVYETMAAKLSPDDAGGHFGLAMWCRDHQLNDEMKEELAAALKSDPDHAGARAALGHVKTDKGWMTQEDAMRAKGMVLVDGQWITKEEAEKRELAGKNRQLILAINAAVYKIRSGSNAVSKEWEERLGKLDNPIVAWKMLDLLGDREPGVRRAACSSLANMRCDMAISRLIQHALLDSNESVQDAAMAALRKLDRKRLLDSLYQIVAGVKSASITSVSDQKLARRLYRRIAFALGKFGDLHSVPFLIEILYPKIEIVSSTGEQAGGIGLGLSGMNTDGASLMGLPQRRVITGIGQADPVPQEPERYYFNQTAEDVLKKLTGQNLGVLPRDWRNWWKENGAELLRKAEAQKRSDKERADKLIEEAGREGQPAK